MCGIVGYIGKQDAYPILIKGLRRLEYRGYDSAGVALINEGDELNVYKTKGKVDNLTEYCGDKDVTGHIGIAHTRWATHGEPSSRNAHPHYSQSHNLAIIHNGIIENYADIKAKLVDKGVQFQSDTCMLVLSDADAEAYLQPEDMFVSLKELYPDCPLVDGYRLQLDGTNFTSLAGVTAPLREGSYLALRIPRENMNTAEEMQTAYDHAKLLLDQIVPQLKKTG
jgi:glutamine phosphoribosylpyrophosphate amidotransferase